MQTLELGSVRTGKIITQISTFDWKQSTANKTIQGDDTGEVIIPIDAVPVQYRANIGAYLRKKLRFINIVDRSRAGNPILHSLVIENFTPSNDKANITIHLMSWKTFFSSFPVIPDAKRARIESASDVFTVSGTPQQCVNQVFTTAFTESGDYAFPQCLSLPTGGSGAYSYDFTLSEVKTIQDFVDDLSSSYEGYEVVFETEYKAGTSDTIVVIPRVGAPHYRKDLEPLTIDIDTKGDGQTAFSYTENGTDMYNWLFMRSQASQDANSDWIDLQSVVKARPTNDEEYMTLAHKEFFSTVMTPEELASQGVSRLSQADVALRTYTISVFDQNFDYVYSLGRRLRVTGSKNLKGLDDMLRIVGVSWNLSDPSSVQITVQPAALRVYPRIPNRLSDILKDMVNGANNANQWDQKPVGAGTGTGGGTVPGGSWGNDGSIPKKDLEVVKSPITRYNSQSNNRLNSLQGYGDPNSPNQITSPIWGTDKFGSMKDQSNGNMMIDSSTAIPNQTQQRFYGLSWSAQILKDPDIDRAVPLLVEVFKSRKFVAFPTWKFDAVGNPGGPLTDANWGLSDLGGLAGELTSDQVTGQMLDANGPGTLKFERLNSGIFFTGAGDEERLVIYFHQLQLFDNGKSHIRSKGFAFESHVDQNTGSLTGGWAVTPYPFDVEGQAESFYPLTVQVASYGPENSYVSCLTPAGYPKDRELGTAYPIVLTDTYWTKIRQGKFAIEDITITKNYRTGQVFQSKGMEINVFQTLESTDERWNEAYQLLSYKGELWATNISYSSYYTKKKNKAGDTNYFMRFSEKTQIDKDGKPVKWEIVSAQYGYRNSTSAFLGGGKFDIVVSSVIGLGDYVFTGSVNEANLPSDASGGVTNVGKVGALEGKIMYGIVPDRTSLTFHVQNNASGAGNYLTEFFPDFWAYNKGTTANLNGQSKWIVLSPSGAIIAAWNGNADNGGSNEIIHGISSMKALNVGNWAVLPAESNSYLMGVGSGGYGQWYWYGL